MTDDFQRRLKNSKTLRQIDEEAAEKSSKSFTEDEPNSQQNQTFFNHNVDFILPQIIDPNNMDTTPIFNTGTI
jgi:hypothetical protein